MKDQTTANPWKTLASRIAYENPWIRVREDEVIRPDGLPGIYGVVECRIATAVIAIDNADQVYLVGQYRYATEEYSWEVIEGGADPAESPLEGAQRELREEAGLEAADWTPLGGEVHLSNCHSSERGWIFLARELRCVPPTPDGTEQLTLRTVPLTEVREMLDRGEFKDAMTLIALHRLFQRLGTGC